MNTEAEQLITFAEDGVCVDAAVLAEALGLDAADVPELMRAGKITSVCEQGTDADAGRYRLTFHYGRQRARLVVDQSGRLLQRSVIDFGEMPTRRSRVAAKT